MEGSAVDSGGGDSFADFVDRLTVRDHKHHAEVGRDKLEGNCEKLGADDVDVVGVTLDGGDEDLAAFLSSDRESGSDMVSMFAKEGADGGHGVVEHVVGDRELITNILSLAGDAVTYMSGFLIHPEVSDWERPSDRGEVLLHFFAVQSVAGSSFQDAPGSSFLLVESDCGGRGDDKHAMGCLRTLSKCGERHVEGVEGDDVRGGRVRVN